MSRLAINMPLFTTAEVIDVVGVRLETLKQWRKRGHLKLSMENPGRGRQRLYSLLDAYRISVINELSGLGFMPSHLADAVYSLAEHPILAMAFEEDGVESHWDEEGRPKRYIHLHFNGEAPEVVHSDKPYIDKGIWLTIDTLGLFAEIQSQMESVSSQRLGNDTLRGCDEKGFPLDPEHPWNKLEGSK